MIIRFAPGIVIDAPYIERLSHETGVSLSYVRPMSGDAHVLAINAAISEQQLQKLLARLTARGDVIYAEEDIRMHPLPAR